VAILGILRQRARRLKAETWALYLAARHPGTPWYVRLLVAAIVAYALSPIDLIPDFVPVLGYVDDLLLLPLGIALAIRLIPPAVLIECRQQVQAALGSGRPVSRVAAAVVILIWLALAALALGWSWEAFGEPAGAPVPAAPAPPMSPRITHPFPV
jgi:uncharacterized membrane protein YkvA (DUF1232 family)